MVVTLVAFLAGAVSVLTPCVLPLLPAILAVSSSGRRSRVPGVVLGIIASFSIGLIALTTLLSAAGTAGEWLRWVAIGLLVAIGVLFLVPAAKGRVEYWTSLVVSRVRPGASDRDGGGFGGGLLTGLALGVAWTPCAGPVLAAVAAAAATDDLGARTLIMLVAFALGMAVPLTLIALGGRTAGTWLRDRIGGRRLDIATGAVLLATALVLATGADLRLNRWVAENTTLGTALTADLESTALERESAGVDDLALTPASLKANGYPETDDLADLGPAPDLVGLGPWFNTADGQPLTEADLDGSVVLVDFWTYSCINCLRTLPHLRSWHDAYADDGLVLLGVHTPEFAFEAEPDNVAKAVTDLDVAWPVAMDNDFETWSSFHNRYWPAKYLIDRDGTLRYVHYGEGNYTETEQAIQGLLQASGTLGSQDLAGASFTRGQTPETYLGYQRGRNFAGFLADDPDTYVVPDEPVIYTGPPGLDRDQWALAGEWTVEDERSVAGRNAELWLHYYGRDVFLVIGDTVARRDEPALVRSEDQGPDGEAKEHTIDGNRLYVLRDTDTPADGLMRLQVPDGVAVYAFTFG